MGLIMDFLDWCADKVEEVKDYIEEKAEDVVDAARDIVSDILDGLAGGISTENSYSIEESDINTTDRLNTMLIEFSENYKRNAVKLETDCADAVEEYYEQLIPIVEKSQTIGFSKTVVTRIKNNKSKIKKLIKNSISQPLSKRMSLDDAECLKILKMDSGEAKKNAMASFAQKVLNETLESLANSVKEIFDMQLEDIEEGLREISEKQEKEFNNLKKYFDSFASSSNDEIGDREKNCVLPMVVFEAAGEVLHLMV